MFAQLAIAWPISLVVFAGLSILSSRVAGHHDSGLREAVLGIGVIFLVPSLLFALLLGVPIMMILAKQGLGLFVPFAAAAGFALVMWLLTAILLPQGWAGAGLALIGYAGVLGLVWGGLYLLIGSRIA